METIRRTPRTTILAVTVVLLFASMAFGYWLNTDEDQQVVAWLVVCTVGSLIAAYLLLRFVPDTESEMDGNAPARRSLVLGVVAALTFVVFWTGLPIVLGVPAVVLGAEGRARAATHDGGAEATAGMLFGGLAILAAVALLVSGA
jgi:hypothetical protein